MSTLIVLLLLQIAMADTSSARDVKCDENKMVSVYIRPYMATIINFPVKPDNVVVGGQKLFSIEYIKADLAITTLSPQAQTNLFVYLTGRRCGFQLVSSPRRHDSLIKVKDPEEGQVKVRLE